MFSPRLGEAGVTGKMMSNYSEKLVEIYSHGQKMFGNFCVPHEGASCVIMSHGLDSSKDGDKWLVLSPRLCEAGFASLRFTYRGCGEGTDKSEGNFEDTTLTSRISDYRAAVDFVLKAKIDKSRLGVIGSSFGGMVAVAGWDERIKAMVILATPYNIPTPKVITDYIELGSGTRLKASFYEDLRQYDMGKAIRKIRCPLLIIQGNNDEIVSVEDAHKLYSHANEPKRLEIIDGANHVFDTSEHHEKIVNLSLEWFRRYL